MNKLHILILFLLAFYSESKCQDFFIYNEDTIPLIIEDTDFICYFDVLRAEPTPPLGQIGMTPKGEYVKSGENIDSIVIEKKYIPHLEKYFIQWWSEPSHFLLQEGYLNQNFEADSIFYSYYSFPLDQNNIYTSYCSLKNGKKEGIQHRFTKRFDSKFNYKDGKRHGLCYFSYKNGRVKQILHYNQGTTEGIYICYDETGGMIEKGIYVQNRKHGIVESYEENRLVARTKYKKGKALWVIEYEKGKRVDRYSLR